MRAIPKKDCSLPPTLRALLQTCLDAGAVNTKVIARALGRSPHTVDAEFKHIFELVGVHSRCDVVLHTLKRGWISWTTPSRILDGCLTEVRKSE